jgi:hypothetical protein
MWSKRHRDLGRTRTQMVCGKRAATMAVTIDAPPGQVWPWLIQMGGDRGFRIMLPAVTYLVAV